MNSHFKRKILQFLMNRFFLKLRQVPKQEEVFTVSSTGEQGSGRVERLIASMTRDEKIDYVSGIDGFCVRPVPRLGIPPVWMGDATSGVRGVDAPVTIFPSAIAMAATWNRQRVEEVGRVIGEECRATGVSVLLAPGVNIARVPVCGRNFEYMGEDPYLAGQIASSYVGGAQSQQIAVTVKHFACNNSEYDRHKCNSVVSTKVLRELYLPAFETVVANGASGVMTAYNPINGTYASENKKLIESILRKEWGFQGIVVSDWNSLYSTEEPLLHGVDIEMPVGKWLSHEAIKRVLEVHPEYEEHLELKVRRLLTVFESMGVLDRPVIDDGASLGTADHVLCAISMASEAIVLLKNDFILPLADTNLSHLVLVGSCVEREPIGGGGSSFIKQGYPGSSLGEELGMQLPGCQITVLNGSWWNSPLKRELVSHADVIVASVGFDHKYESESYDRQWNLPKYDLSVINEACSINEHVVVAIHGGGALEMESWVQKPQAILHSWYLGEVSARAITAILLGKANPSGRLPISIARRLEDYESMQNYPQDFAKMSLGRIQGGQDNPHKRGVWPLAYKEGHMVGYRQFDTIGPEPLFPFGFGLSYTNFSYTDLRVSPLEESLWEVTFTVSNSGDRQGAEVAQLYIRPTNCNRNRPFQQLQSFTKVHLEPGENCTLTLTIGIRAFSAWDEEQDGWQCVHGLYTIAVGSSSRDIRLSAKVEA